MAAFENEAFRTLHIALRLPGDQTDEALAKACEAVEVATGGNVYRAWATVSPSYEPGHDLRSPS